jgi:polyisoprenyl-phosphate glycosyltransferase
MGTDPNTIELSIVSTIYNDAKIVPLLVDELIKEANKLNVSYEIILVNDSSRDNSEEAIKEVCQKHSFVKGISLARNYGQQIAVSAGMRNASGKYVLIIDGDLENPISSIGDLYKRIREDGGYDIVFAVSKVRQTFYKRMTSEMFWFVISRLLKITIIKNQLLLRIMSRKMVSNYNSYGEISRSVAGINHDIGLRSAKIEVVPNKRVSGKSNYSFSKRLNIFIDIVLNMSSKPLNFVIFFGFFAIVCSLGVVLFYLYRYFTGVPLTRDIFSLLSSLLFGSFIVFTLGIMSRYLSLIYLEVRNRPLFIVKEKYNL